MNAPNTSANTHYTLYTQVHRFYMDMLEALPSAQERITMMYFTFDSGEWAAKMAEILAAKAAAGVQVRLMVDEFGLALDAPRHTFQNLRLLAGLRQAGVQVEKFRPGSHRLGPGNRLHTKICALDTHTAFIGGSNIGDHYLEWNDNNLRLSGELGTNLHTLFDFVRCHTPEGQTATPPNLHLSRLFAGDAQIFLTVPKQRYDIRRALLKLILDAEKAIYIRNWYFLPDKEILNALRSQAQKGVSVNVLFSHRTRVPLIDIANHVHGHKLAKAGGHVYRFTGGFMHAKVAWNDHRDVLFGSANMDAKALQDNFECSLVLNDAGLARQLRQSFEADTTQSILQTPHISLPLKALSYACNLASPWL